MKHILVSACLLGISCKYNGGHNDAPQIKALMDHPDLCLIPVCPEQLGGLPTPRLPSECSGTSVIQINGCDVTEAFHKGAAEALRIAKQYHCQTAILKARSPSCGFGKIYDGTFTQTLTDGMGITASYLHKENIRILNETMIDEIE